jgi:hypothetical protein
MRNPMPPLRKPSVVMAVAIFLLVYFFSLLVWIQAKNYYGYAVTLTASKVVSGLKDVKLDGLERKADIIQATFAPLTGDTGMLIDVPIQTSNYTFNVPLTLAVMAGLYLFLRRRKRAYAEALAILVGVHLLYVFSLEIKVLTEILMNRGFETVNVTQIAVYQFLWGFTDNMVIRFEPFLIGFYMFLRFRRPAVQ